jgi:protein-L-isoaspartate(D-aspartate) O-methyltransferase
MATAEDANDDLVDQLIARGALWSGPLIAAFRATPRHRFLDRVFHYQRGRTDGLWREVDTREPGRGELRLLYSDRALTTRLSEPDDGRPAVPISSSSQPSLMAQMLEDLRLRPGLRVLEIGAGTGYNAALLAHVVGRVLSLDVDRRVLAEAEEHLRAFPDREVSFRHGDGRLGWPAAAPFDRIVVTAATPDLEPAWLEQLAGDGLLLAPMELAPGLAYLVCGGVRGGCFEGRLTRPAYFMPLRAEDPDDKVTRWQEDKVKDGGSPATDPSATLSPSPPVTLSPCLPQPGPEELTAVMAPWAEWLERRPACGGPGLLPALAFLGWLEGLAVCVQNLADGRTFYGVADKAAGHACWLGQREWRVTGNAGRDLGNRLWRTFLDAGGPWPTEFRLRAWPHGEDVPCRTHRGRTYRRLGPRCAQVWELIESRERPA